ncbi:hypothetical protein EYC84_010836 [Monilinia fructicola]|uniref:Uncharacterized protein n=1 Tax=Monilinia fructicola TaxID=38448 RepID=A0A5M9JB16_MONFR|nr:hypothetical protein EYC84_010836 [Monilinia fructicola]
MAGGDEIPRAEDKGRERIPPLPHSPALWRTLTIQYHFLSSRCSDTHALNSIFSLGLLTIYPIPKVICLIPINQYPSLKKLDRILFRSPSVPAMQLKTPSPISHPYYIKSRHVSCNGLCALKCRERKGQFWHRRLSDQQKYRVNSKQSTEHISDRLRYLDFIRNPV